MCIRDSQDAYSRFPEAKHQPVIGLTANYEGIDATLRDRYYKMCIRDRYKVITEGHGEVPKASDEVEVIYEGRLIDGTVLMLHPSMVAARQISSVPTE